MSDNDETLSPKAWDQLEERMYPQQYGVDKTDEPDAGELGNQVTHAMTRAAMTSAIAAGLVPKGAQPGHIDGPAYAKLQSALYSAMRTIVQDAVNAKLAADNSTR
jgi:hypothetical protein